MQEHFEAFCQRTEGRKPILHWVYENNMVSIRLFDSDVIPIPLVVAVVLIIVCECEQISIEDIAVRTGMNLSQIRWIPSKATSPECPLLKQTIHGPFSWNGEPVVPRKRMTLYCPDLSLRIANTPVYRY
jgi:hypothetical protein